MLPIHLSVDFVRKNNKKALQRKTPKDHQQIRDSLSPPHLTDLHDILFFTAVYFEIAETSSFTLTKHDNMTD